MTAAALAAPVAALVRRCGAPARVASRDDGHHFTFLDDGATVDALVDPDRELVRALDVSSPAPQTLRAFASEAAGPALPDTDFAFATSRAYRLDETRELVLVYDATLERLTRVAIGERAALQRVGIMPLPVDQPPFPYVAPVLRHSALADGTGTQTTIVRIDVDRNGIVRNVAVVVASTDAAFDATLASRLGDDTYAPARLSGRPIAGSVFRELRH
ncbi:MAG TPA: hypothetical protein VGP41_10530 [Candidatus Lustribacter sp.]|nr:hypothetical protein [Candidatus Lustribacter sp.]